MLTPLNKVGQYGEFVFLPLSLWGGWDYAPGKEAVRQMAEKSVETKSPTMYQTW